MRLDPGVVIVVHHVQQLRHDLQQNAHRYTRRTQHIVSTVIWRKSSSCSGSSRFPISVVGLLPYVRKEGNVLFNDTLNTLYLRLYGERVAHLVAVIGFLSHWLVFYRMLGRKEMFYLTKHSTHFIYRIYS